MVNVQGMGIVQVLVVNTNNFGTGLPTKLALTACSWAGVIW